MQVVVVVGKTEWRKSEVWSVACMLYKRFFVVSVFGISFKNHRQHNDDRTSKDLITSLDSTLLCVIGREKILI